MDSTDDFLSRAAVAQLAVDYFAGLVSYREFVDGVHEHPDPDVEQLYDLVEHVSAQITTLEWSLDESDQVAPIRAVVSRLWSTPVGGAR